VTHVDASKPSITWARDNQLASKLQDKQIRWILDDAGKFVEREIKRGNKYDAIIMDPPVYGHGPTGQIWKFSEDFPKLLSNCAKILSDKPLFVIVNAYAISSSALMLENLMRDYLPKGQIEVGELALQEKTSKRLLSTGIFARWMR
jgi:23S rRNA (cytosine1962-C5)-methyltransferase